MSESSRNGFPKKNQADRENSRAVRLCLIALVDLPEGFITSLYRCSGCCLARSGVSSGFDLISPGQSARP